MAAIHNQKLQVLSKLPLKHQYKYNHNQIHSRNGGLRFSLKWVSGLVFPNILVRIEVSENSLQPILIYTPHNCSSFFFYDRIVDFGRC